VSARDAACLWEEPRSTNLLDMVATPAARYPGLPALFFSRDGVAHEALTWSALWHGAQAAAHRLSDRGLASATPVLVATATSPAFFSAFFGVLAAGGIPVPIAAPASRRPARLERYTAMLAGIAADAGARSVLTSTDLESTLADCARQTGLPLTAIAVDGTLPVTRSGGTAFPSRVVRPDDLALLQYTSGSTGHPRGVALSHRNVITNIGLIADAIVTPTSSAVSWLPLHHDMGLLGGALTALFTRRPALLLSPQAFAREPAVWLRAIDAFRASITLAPSFAFAHTARSVTAADLADLSLDCLRTVLNGAEPVDVDAIDTFETVLAECGLPRHVVRPVYGLAESALAVTFADAGPCLVENVDADALEYGGRAIRQESGTATAVSRTRRLVSVGRPLPTQEVRIVAHGDRSQPDRTVGEIVVRGPSVMVGYYNRPDETRETLRGGWLHTGDLGYIADGRLFVTGRLKELIIRHGRNYDPADIEAIAARAAGAAGGGAAAFAVGTDGEPRVVIVAETRLREAAALENLARRIRQCCHEALLFGPDDLRLVPRGAIPRTTSGKVRRAECRRLYLENTLPTIVSGPHASARP
jgi:acyl-CoA synthetase (AMP-forming)/AMP-acid ligase II